MCRSPWLIGALFSFAVLAVGCLPAYQMDVAGQLDLVRFDGITYEWIGPLPAESVNRDKAVDAVKAELAANVNREPYDVPEDGYATYLEPGTPVHAVKRYDPSFRIAARTDQKWLAYEVVENPAAEKTEGLLDIRGKVIRVTVRDAPDDGGTAAFRRPNEARAFVGTVLDLPTRRVFAASAASVYLAFELDDGTEVVRPYEPASNELQLEKGEDASGVELSKELGEALEEAAGSAAPAK